MGAMTRGFRRREYHVGVCGGHGGNGRHCGNGVHSGRGHGHWGGFGIVFPRKSRTVGKRYYPISHFWGGIVMTYWLWIKYLMQFFQPQVMKAGILHKMIQTQTDMMMQAYIGIIGKLTCFCRDNVNLPLCWENLENSRYPNFLYNIYNQK